MSTNKGKMVLNRSQKELWAELQGWRDAIPFWEAQVALGRNPEAPKKLAQANTELARVGALLK